MNYIRAQRQKHRISQENLAETCGLSLRTIQRVEAGHRVSYPSLRSLATKFEIDVDLLEQELYAMKNKSDEYRELPLWVRLAVGRGWFSATRGEYIKIETFFHIMGIFSVIMSFIVPEKQAPLIPFTIDDLCLIVGLSVVYMAYIYSMIIRLGDEYSAWEAVEATQPGGIFGLFKNKKLNGGRGQN